MTILMDVGVGLASNLIWEALKRPIETISSEIRRHDQLSRPLTGKISLKATRDTALVDKIISDISRVIGNSTGNLTDDVSFFIRELRATAIPEAIARASLAGECSERLRVSFRAFHGRFDNIPFSADELFDVLYEACLNRIESVSDRALLDIIRAQHASLIGRVESIAHSLGKGLKDSSSVSPEECRDARIRIAKSIQNEHKYISIETLRGPKKVALKSISIPSRLAILNSSHISAAKIPRDIATQGYLPFRRKFHRAVVVGDPGGGKSTLTQMISADLARLILTDATRSGIRQIEDRDLQLPLRVMLRRYEARAAKTPSYSLLDHLRDDVKSALDGDDHLANGYLSAALGNGEAIVIFDGLDEVLDIGARAHMVELIEQFSATYPGCPVLVTSRLVGYRDAPFNDEFVIYGLDRFNNEEIRKYSSNAIAAIGQVKRDEAAAKAADFFLQSSRVGSDIRDNPLMLGLMVQIYLIRGDVPGNRPEVYKECATLMFEKWDDRRQIVVNVPRSDIELLDVFGYVASRTYGDAASEDGVTREWLVTELRKHFSDWYVDKASANRAASSLVEFLTGRAWVMSEVGQGTFKFTHRTFLEYFFARHLISQSKSIESLLKIDIIPYVVNNQRVVICQLAIHMATFRDGGKSKQAAETLEYILKASNYSAKQELSLLKFVVSSLPYLVIPEAIFLSISNLCISKSITIGAASDVSALNVIEVLINNSNSRSEMVKRDLIDKVSVHLSSSGGADLLFSMYLVARGNQLVDGVIRRARSVRAGGWYELSKVAEAYKSHLFEIAHKDSSVARAYIHLYDEGRSELYSAIGSDLLLSSASSLAPPEVDDLIFRSIHLVTNARVRSKNVQSIDASEFIRMLSLNILKGEVVLHRFLAPGRVKGREVDVRVEEAFRDIWMAMHGAHKYSLSPKSYAECLLCLVSTVEPMGSESTQDVPNSIHTVPLEVISEMVRRVEDGAIRGWLEDWAEQNMLPIKMRRRSREHIPE